MISPDALLYIYEIRGDSGVGPSAPPPSFIGLWNEEGFLYLFFTRSEDAYVQEIACGLVSVPVSRNVMSYRDWQAGLPRAGLTIGGVHFVPDDHSAPPSGSVLLDPSVVFGDGTHPTTVAVCATCSESSGVAVSRRSLTSEREAEYWLWLPHAWGFDTYSPLTGIGLQYVQLNGTFSGIPLRTQ